MKQPTFSQEDLALRMTYPGFVLRALRSEGHEVRALLLDTGLTEDVFSEPETRVEWPRLRRFLLNAMEQTGEPHLGVRLARQFEASFIGLPAYVAMNAATFEDALAVMSRFLFLAFPAIEFVFPDKEAAVRPGECAIRLRPKLPLGHISYFVCASALIACEGVCRAILRMPNAALRGEMSTRRPEGWAQVEGQIGFPIRFEAPHIRLFLPARLLSQALPGADPLNHRLLLSLCDEIAERERAEATRPGQVALFLQEAQNLTLSMSQVAAALGYSERGLRRHLERSGTTFRELRTQIREQRARSMLANTAMPIKAIAYELGFDTPSNFARSFIRWTGTSPSAFRLAASSSPGSTGRTPAEGVRHGPPGVRSGTQTPGNRL